MSQDDLRKDLGRITTSSMADVIELRIREYLKKKSFKPGDALPREIELAEALGVSRNVVREALSRLRMLGMIETKRRRGMVLANPDILGTLERVMDPLIMDEDTLQDIFELRLVLEMGLADILYIRKTEKHIRELEEIVENEVASTDHTFRIKNEIAFHGKLYEITGNKTLKRFQSLLMPVFGYLMSTKTNHKSGAVSHKDLVAILKNGSKLEFREGMYEHLLPHFDRLEK
ncbi:DNA-binding FadR family transcriptional regulator [Anseongella ginsenosidimutans]|uniref:DNA-binding FadR family transcriptional regulator n=1 Tax=Anseongella ginsenosidimutans TaxID=496056 RepID=A0A4R3KN73_9SPHI|nr:GntR family transcriptional regulator [Anseongella ginsenosidimutans]QEC52357.1 FadR family transcriptional regulator [Anseongella ginsenosidimutans]TCS85901.1 DNA-binding FadR family transcriptional regulator [Anseongella ginsenosidimutans]